MGRPRWFSRVMVESCHKIDASLLNRSGVFKRSTDGAIEWRDVSGSIQKRILIESLAGDEGIIQSISLSYVWVDHIVSSSTLISYDVQLSRTPCYFGGFRYWLSCPLGDSRNRCGRRVLKLYQPPGAKYFGCRHCYDLTYRSQKEHDKRLDYVLKHPHLLQQLAQSQKASDLILLSKAYQLLEQSEPPVPPC